MAEKVTIPCGLFLATISKRHIWFHTRHIKFSLHDLTMVAKFSIQIFISRFSDSLEGWVSTYTVDKVNDKQNIFGLYGSCMASRKSCMSSKKTCMASRSGSCMASTKSCMASTKPSMTSRKTFELIIKTRKP